MSKYVEIVVRTNERWYVPLVIGIESCSDGEAAITDIRRLSGLNRNEANYRFRKLEEMGLINVTYEASPGDLPDRKVPHLTGTAERKLGRGLGSATAQAQSSPMNRGRPRRHLLFHPIVLSDPLAADSKGHYVQRHICGRYTSYKEGHDVSSYSALRAHLAEGPSGQTVD